MIGELQRLKLKRNKIGLTTDVGRSLDKMFKRRKKTNRDRISFVFHLHHEHRL